ncbi:unnamed protein product [Prunus armeniaca]
MQYCTFLMNRNDTQALPETSSARRRKNPEVATRAEQTTHQPQELMKTESPGKPSIHLASSSVNQLLPSQTQGEYEPIPVEGQEDWTEEYEEKQSDYEPSADDQIGLLETGEQEDWTEEYGEEQMEYDGELDEEIEPFGAELECLLQEDLGINMIFILPEEFKAVDGQGSTLEGDVLSQETSQVADSNTFDVTNFAGGATKTHGTLDVDVIVGTKKLKIAFFVVDTTSTTYNALLGRDWIHQSLCVPSTLHQQLAF